MNSSNNEVLKLRALITSAYFKGETDKIARKLSGGLLRQKGS